MAYTIFNLAATDNIFFVRAIDKVIKLNVDYIR